MTVWRQGRARVFPRARALVVGDQLKPDDGDRKQEQRYDQRTQRVREVKVIRPGVKPGQEARQAASGREPVDQRDAHEHDADNSDDPWHWLGHEAGLTEAQESGKRQLISVAFIRAGVQPKPTPTAPGARRMSR